MVVIVCPSASGASTRHAGTSRPFRITEHAPQSPVVQPSFVPVRPTVLRSASSRLSPPSQRNSIGWPLIVASTWSFAIPIPNLDVSSRLPACDSTANVTIERKGRKEEPYFLAAFAAFAFYGGHTPGNTHCEFQIPNSERGARQGQQRASSARPR